MHVKSGDFITTYTSFIKVIEYFGTNKGDGCQIRVLYLDQFSKLISIERRQKMK